MTDMTLEQVRQYLESRRREHLFSTLDPVDAELNQRAIDAIDAVLKAQAEPVGYVSADALKDLESGEALNIRLWRSSDDFVAPVVDVYAHSAPPDAQDQDARDAWQPIETLSDAPDLVLAYVPPDEQFPPGRMMIWRRDILARNLAGPTPEHLMFPAAHWMPLPPPPAMAREASDAT